MKIPPETFQLISGLPGEELIAPGLRDIEGGKVRTSGALLILMARARLTDAGLGFLDEMKTSLPDTPEALLYESLSEDDSESAYHRYNSLKRRLASFLHCLEARTAVSNR